MKLDEVDDVAVNLTSRFEDFADNISTLFTSYKDVLKTSSGTITGGTEFIRGVLEEVPDVQKTNGDDISTDVLEACSHLKKLVIGKKSSRSRSTEPDTDDESAVSRFEY
jgi:hypothetical protein